MPRLSARHSVPLLLSLCCSEAVVLSWPDRLAHWLLTKLARRKAHGVAAATLSATGARCTIAEEGPELPLSLFAERYREAQQPVVIRNATIRLQAAQRFRELSRVSRLLAEFGDRQVTLSSANAFSYGRRRMRLDAYLEQMAQIPWAQAERADDLFYLFGEHGDELQPLLDKYPLPHWARRVSFSKSESAGRPSDPRVYNLARRLALLPNGLVSCHC